MDRHHIAPVSAVISLCQNFMLLEPILTRFNSCFNLLSYSAVLLVF